MEFKLETSEDYRQAAKRSEDLIKNQKNLTKKDISEIRKNIENLLARAEKLDKS